MAITSFQLDLDIPLMVMPIEEGINQDDMNRTIFNLVITEEKITDVVAYVVSTGNVTYTPEEERLYSPWPKAPKWNNGVQDISSDHYFIQSYQTFCDMVNTAIRSMIENPPAGATDWNTLFAPIKAGAPVRYPVLEYRDQRFIWRYSGAWVTDDTSYNVTGNPRYRYKISLNGQLKHLLAGFKYRSSSYIFPKNNYFDLILKDSVRSGAATLDSETGINGEDANSILSLKQEYDTRFRFNSISSIILTSDYIKVRPEYYPDTVNPNDTESRNISFNTPIKNIISSFGLVDQSGAITWQEQQYYVPSVLKWIDLISSDSLDVIDARVYYQLKRGGLVPAKVPIDSQSTIKFLFRRKTALGD